MRAGARRSMRWRAGAACRWASVWLLAACLATPLDADCFAAFAGGIKRADCVRQPSLTALRCAVTHAPQPHVLHACWVAHLQDFMGFLHLGWESATFEDDGLAKPLAELSPLWAVVAQVRGEGMGVGVHLVMEAACLLLGAAQGNTQSSC